MPFHERSGLRYYSFDIFQPDLKQAIFTRRGGVSAQPWSSLNLGGSVGDEAEHVAENRERVFSAMGRDPASIHDVWLVHGTDIVYADSPRPLNGPPEKADILFTDRPEVSLLMRFADCVPLMFHDPIKKVIGIAHAGWRGTLNDVALAAINGMISHYACKPGNIVAAIGPSIEIMPDEFLVLLERVLPVGGAATQQHD